MKTKTKRAQLFFYHVALILALLNLESPFINVNPHYPNPIHTMNRQSTSNKRQATAPPGLAAEEISTGTLPTRAAFDALETAVLSLQHQPLQKVLRDVSRKVINHLPKLAHHIKARATLASGEKPPKSVCFQFKLHASKAVELSAPFKALNAETATVLANHQRELLAILLQAKDLEIASLRNIILDEINLAVQLFAKSYVIWNDGHHAIVKPYNMNKILSRVLQTNEVRNTLSFSTSEMNRALILIIPIATQNIDDLNEPQITAIAEPLLLAIRDPIAIFETTRRQNENAHSIASLFSAKTATRATAEVAMAIDDIDGLDQATLQQLITTNVAKATKSLNQKVALLSKKLRESSSKQPTPKNSKEGGTPEPAFGKKPENQDPAAATVNAPPAAKTLPPAKKRKPKSKKSTKKRSTNAK